MKKTCVIGWPIAHSRSPLIHNYWLKQHGIDSLYEKLAIPPAELEAFISNLPKSDYLGCNVTIPHKEQAFALVANKDAIATRIGAANTLYMKDGTLHATNTDGEGFVASLHHASPGLQLAGANVTVFGAGGAAKSIIVALIAAGVARISVINRNESRAEALVASFGSTLQAFSQEKAPTVLEAADLLVNTTSLGMAGQPELNVDVALLKPGCVVADIVYVPLKTELLKRAEARGLRCINGIGMLLHQAVRGFELWYGVRPQVTPELQAMVIEDVRSHAPA